MSKRSNRIFENSDGLRSKNVFFFFFGKNGLNYYGAHASDNAKDNGIRGSFRIGRVRFVLRVAKSAALECRSARSGR